MNAPNDANGRPLLAAGRLAGSPSLHAAKFKMSPAAAAARHQTSPDLTGRRAEVSVFRESGQFPPPDIYPDTLTTHKSVNVALTLSSRK